MKKMRLQSIILITLGIMGWLLPALAQVKRYPTDRELQQLVDKFENRDIPIARTTAEFGMGQRSERLESFTRAWAAIDPAIAPFLGAWNSSEDSLMIYPSTFRGRVCVILTLPGGRNRIDGFFAIGSISNGQMRVKSNGWYHNFLSSGGVLIRSGNYLGIASVSDNKPNIDLYSAFSNPLEAIEQLPFNNRNSLLQQFEQAGCTTSLPTTKNIAHTNLPPTHLELSDSESLKQSSPSIANLPDGNHAFVHPRSNAGRGRGLDRSFFFRKTGDRVIGSYVSGPLGICIEGKILSDGRIVGIGLDSSDGGFPTPQRPPQAYAQGLNGLWGIEEVQVGELVVLNVRRPDINGYEVWYKFEKVLINLDGYVRRQDLVRDESRKTCQMYHPYTGERIDPDDLIEALDENDLVIFK
ncbi:hypothetical protein [Roseofilum capinflatum]|uniref:Uncharacterized protein n=1 Tax=Roseofilum capinflatum BLCC-M114 TaxID=3022440 RepID=A0ABT7B7Z4_9CYAN|nr:hypothetical protein [Roseofilum capinflatum]MDJ1174666.1 hypothetical protein [Roseofilum capinflatum BLCC-M114]